MQRYIFFLKGKAFWSKIVFIRCVFSLSDLSEKNIFADFQAFDWLYKNVFISLPPKYGSYGYYDQFHGGEDKEPCCRRKLRFDV